MRTNTYSSKLSGKVSRMRRSKLEMYAEILKILEKHGPLKLTHIMHKANMNCSTLKKHLDFLVSQGLVEERTVEKRKVIYATTQHVITVLEYFKKLEQALPIMEETRNTAENEITGPIISWSTT